MGRETQLLSRSKTETVIRNGSKNITTRSWFRRVPKLHDRMGIGPKSYTVPVCRGRQQKRVICTESKSTTQHCHRSLVHLDNMQEFVPILKKRQTSLLFMPLLQAIFVLHVLFWRRNVMTLREFGVDVAKSAEILPSLRLAFGQTNGLCEAEAHSSPSRLSL